MQGLQAAAPCPRLMTMVVVVVDSDEWSDTVTTV